MIIWYIYNIIQMNKWGTKGTNELKLMTKEVTVTYKVIILMCPRNTHLPTSRQCRKMFFPHWWQVLHGNELTPEVLFTCMGKFGISLFDSCVLFVYALRVPFYAAFILKWSHRTITVLTVQLICGVFYDTAFASVSIATSKLKKLKSTCLNRLNNFNFKS